MDPRQVIVRSHDGEPLKRVAVRADSGLVYVVNPDLLTEFEAGATHAVGFPEADVYEYDEELFRRLRQDWEAGLMRKGWAAIRPHRSAEEKTDTARHIAPLFAMLSAYLADQQ